MLLLLLLVMLLLCWDCCCFGWGLPLLVLLLLVPRLGLPAAVGVVPMLAVPPTADQAPVGRAGEACPFPRLGGSHGSQVAGERGAGLGEGRWACGVQWGLELRYTDWSQELQHMLPWRLACGVVPWRHKSGWPLEGPNLGVGAPPAPPPLN